MKKIIFINTNLFPSDTLVLIQQFVGKDYLVMFADIKSNLEVYEV